MRLVVFGALGAWFANEVLRARAAGGPPPPVRTRIVIDAPIERLWAVLSDIEGQPRWMHDMKTVSMSTAKPTRVGSRGEATVRMFGLSSTDPVTVTALEPPTRFAITHEGRFSGSGTFDLEPGADGSTTILRWEEHLVAPELAHLVAVATAPVFHRIFQRDLERLRDMVETGAAPGTGAANESPGPLEARATVEAG